MYIYIIQFDLFSYYITFIKKKIKLKMISYNNSYYFNLESFNKTTIIKITHNIFIYINFI